MKQMGIACALSLALLNAAHANEVVIPGSFAVSESGAATYSIDIDVPPGTAGMEPKLSLTYSSQGGNGLLGMGWSLSGLSSITRCPKTVAQDGVRGAIKFDADDRFCLDGQRLIATSGTYGASGAEYRTEMEGFAKVLSFGLQGDGPARFQAHTKSGLTMHYGLDFLARMYPSNSNSVMTWPTDRIQDKHGNTIGIQYHRDIANSTFRPNRIDYTANPGSFASVRFFYETRNDVPLQYHAGAQIRTPERMSSIKTYVGENLVLEYRFAYEYSPYSARSRLVSIEKCDAAGICLPKTNLDYPDSTYAGLSITTRFSGQNGTLLMNRPYVADFNGDGFSDVMWDEKYPDGRSLGNRSLWLSASNNNYAITSNLAGQDGSYVAKLPHIADFNGDGFQDILWVYSDIYGLSEGRRHIWMSNGDGTFTLMSGIEPTLPLWDYAAHVGDFNGDGFADILWDHKYEDGRSQGTRKLWLGLGDGSFNKIDNVAGQDGGFKGKLPHIADFNGDGFQDILWVYSDIYGLSEGRRHLWMSNGDGTFALINNIEPTLPLWDYAAHVGDFNGDGTADILWDHKYEDGRSQGTRKLWLGLGDGSFNKIDNVAGQDGGFKGKLPYIADFDGDGFQDILWVYSDVFGLSNSRRHLWMSKGDGTFGLIANIHSAHPLFDYTAHLGDFNGDGLVDIFWDHKDEQHRSLGTRVLWQSTNQLTFDTLTSIDDGFGEKVRLTYAPLTDSSVYTKGTGATYPEVDLQVPSYVVSRAEVRDGIGGFVPTGYRYGGLKARADGRGSLGFAWTEAEQVETDFVTRREYRQDYPYVGRVSLERTSAPGVGLAGVLSEKTYSFACLDPANGLGCVEAAGNRYFPHASSIVEKGWDLDGSVLPVVTTTNAYDSWGNATQIDVVTSDGFSKSTTNTYTNDAVNWILGRLTRTEVTDVSP